jgi:hypothetical protein
MEVVTARTLWGRYPLTGEAGKLFANVHPGEQVSVVG